MVIFRLFPPRWKDRRSNNSTPYPRCPYTANPPEHMSESIHTSQEHNFFVNNSPAWRLPSEQKSWHCIHCVVLRFTGAEKRKGEKKIVISCIYICTNLPRDLPLQSSPQSSNDPDEIPRIKGKASWTFCACSVGGVRTSPPNHQAAELQEKKYNPPS